MSDLEEECKKITKYSLIIFILICVGIVFPFLFGFSFDIVEPLGKMIKKNFYLIFRIWSRDQW